MYTVLEFQLNKGICFKKQLLHLRFCLNKKNKKYSESNLLMKTSSAVGEDKVSLLNASTFASAVSDVLCSALSSEEWKALAASKPRNLKRICMRMI
jgi:hypothetical protein